MSTQTASPPKPAAIITPAAGLREFAGLGPSAHLAELLRILEAGRK